MKTKLIFLLLLSTGFFFACISNKKQSNQTIIKSENTIVGKWERIGQTGPIGFEFKDNDVVEGDFGNDQTDDIIAKYELSGATFNLLIKKGKCARDLGSTRFIKQITMYP